MNIFEISATWPEKTEKKSCGIPFCSKGRKATTARMHWACCLPKPVSIYQLVGARISFLGQHLLVHKNLSVAMVSNASQVHCSRVQGVLEEITCSFWPNCVYGAGHTKHVEVQSVVWTTAPGPAKVCQMMLNVDFCQQISKELWVQATCREVKLCSPAYTSNTGMMQSCLKIGKEFH